MFFPYQGGPRDFGINFQKGKVIKIQIKGGGAKFDERPEILEEG